MHSGSLCVVTTGEMAGSEARQRSAAASSAVLHIIRRPFCCTTRCSRPSRDADAQVLRSCVLLDELIEHEGPADSNGPLVVAQASTGQHSHWAVSSVQAAPGGWVGLLVGGWATLCAGSLGVYEDLTLAWQPHSLVADQDR